MEAINTCEIYGGMPDRPEIYENEYDFWPWGKMIRFIAKWIERNIAANACLLDYMCGTGFLLNKLVQRRPDLDCYGCSLTSEYINYALCAYPRINVELCDAQKYRPKREPDVVICTAGIHHLPWDSQSAFVQKVASELESGKIFIVGEELVRDFNDEKTRRHSIIEMINAVMAFMIEKDAPSEMMATAVNVLKADLTGQEYKVDMKTILKMIDPHFDIEEQHRIWPDNEMGYGDYAFICRRR